MVPPYSQRVSRVHWYSGYSRLTPLFAYRTLTFCGWLSQAILLSFVNALCCPNPENSVWPLPRSLATTYGISVDFFSSPYLDVSVQAVPHIRLFYSPYVDCSSHSRVSPFGNPRVEACFRLTVAYRRSLRPSSAPGAKAFPLRSL